MREQEQKDQSRMDTMGDSTDSRTAPTVAPDSVECPVCLGEGNCYECGGRGFVPRCPTCADLRARLTAAEQAREEVEKREANNHYIIQQLWSIVNPEDDPRLMEMVHVALGCNDPNGDCGNTYCGLLYKAEAERDQALAALSELEQERQRLLAHWEDPTRAEDL